MQKQISVTSYVNSPLFTMLLLSPLYFVIVLFNDGINCWNCVTSVSKQWKGVEPLWDNNYRREPNYLERNLSQCQFFHHKSHMDRSGVEHPRPQWQAGDYPPTTTLHLFLGRRIWLPLYCGFNWTWQLARPFWVNNTRGTLSPSTLSSILPIKKYRSKSKHTKVTVSTFLCYPDKGALKGEA